MINGKIVIKKFNINIKIIKQNNNKKYQYYKKNFHN